ncbi:DJ-1/PfpI family protein [Ensifer adhaerens]|uniref:GlxA family transcriptional regulator n=1 Tax=Ensifer adhaerens TaxID=106592 RepID=UPI001CBDECD7|nr:helix-turn-helix domain-containing protein [Ensifer adhaerens]MBZ7922358.1 DJ-1/PfpI family protein [Ensifer adhaerens]UAX90992.1 DJ-1/PfpI family protein [Ensifer adhaerens]UAX98621.1 DJ-1/PfpI family protein [Ensifer adhaerens]UAY06002.1 DJ-1/PfpI family protein [Ensifer adhaerens]
MTRNVAFVLFDRTKLIDVTGPLQVFNDARTASGSPAYAISLVSETGGPIATDTGVALETRPFSICASAPPDTLLVSGGQSALEAANSDALLAFLADMAGKCRRLGSICLGAFILARGGHLDGRRATTHWEDCEQFRRDFPAIEVREDSIFEEDRGIWTSAGVTAGIDMALAMVEEDLGRSEALRLARSLVLYVKRTGGQRQFSAALHQQMTSRGDRFDALVAEIRSDPAADLSVPRLAEMARMSERNFSRLFTQTMGASPAQFIEELRVDAACEAIQRGDASVSQAPFLFGFGNAERMRRAFQRRKGISPSDYAARFGPGRLPSAS